MTEMEKSWEKRLAGGPDKLTVDFVESLSIDRRLYKYDIVGSIAHAQMLAEQKLISKDEFGRIRDGLVEISEEIAEGRFTFEKRYEDIHMAIETALVAKIGEAGKKLHTGRSRNDQVAADLRLWMRDRIEILQAKITLLQKAFVKDVLMIFNYAARTSKSSGSGQQTLYFKTIFQMPTKTGHPKMETVELKAICGPGDTAAPVVTIMKTNED